MTADTAPSGGRVVITPEPGVLSVAVVGLGSIAFEHLERIDADLGAQLVGVCDVSGTVAHAVADRMGAGAPFTDFGEMLAVTRPDVVHVLTPPASHHQLALQALKAGAHVFVEKPITATWEEYVDLREAARESGRMLCENYNYRFTDVVLHALDLWRSGAIGDVVSVHASFGGVMGPSGPYADPDVPHFAHGLRGGALQNFVSHPVSLVLPFLGPCHDVRVWQRGLGDGTIGNNELRALLAGERTVGSVAVSATEHPPAFSLVVGGSAGSLEVDIYNRRLELHSASSASVDLVRSGTARLGGSLRLLGRRVAGRQNPYEGLGTLLTWFYAAVRSGASPPVSVAEMDAVNEVVGRLFDAERQS